MSTTRSITLPLFAVAVMAGAPLSATQQPTLEEVLTRAGEYHTTYAPQLSGVSLNEEAQVLDVTGGKARGVIRISSDVVFVNLQQQITALRDPYAVDTQALRPKTPRIMALLAAPATPTSKDWDLAASDIETVGVRFEEPTGQEQFHVLGTRSNARATGRFWIDPLTGAIHQTELWVDSKLENAVVSVKYARHATLGLLLPTEMTETYDEREGGGGPRQMGPGANPRGSVPTRVSVQARSVYSQATYSPIDLTKLR